MCCYAAARSICAVHSLGSRTWWSHKESLPTPTSTRSLAPTLERDGGRATCSTLLGLCPPPDSSDSELELSAVRHQPEGLDQLQAQTKFTKKELQSLYRGFKNVSAPHLPPPGLALIPRLSCSGLQGAGRPSGNSPWHSTYLSVFMGLMFCGTTVWREGQGPESLF